MSEIPCFPTIIFFCFSELHFFKNKEYFKRVLSLIEDFCFYPAVFTKSLDVNLRVNLF